MRKHCAQYIYQTDRFYLIPDSLPYFDGGDPLEIMMAFGVSHTEVMESVWYVVQAVNDVPEFKLSYPESHDKQREIAAEFQARSGANFGCCAGAIGGVLLWIVKPSPEQCQISGCDSGKFYCSRKAKFGLNSQAFSDCRGRILDVSIVFPGSTSDCLAFESSNLHSKLETLSCSWTLPLW